MLSNLNILLVSERKQSLGNHPSNRRGLAVGWMRSDVSKIKTSIYDQQNTKVYIIVKAVNQYYDKSKTNFSQNQHPNSLLLSSFQSTKGK
jgi:hypothetical protein